MTVKHVFLCVSTFGLSGWDDFRLKAGQIAMES
jgi:hypothetical protein